MSISGISSSSNAYQNQLQQIAQAFSNLQTDVSTGSLSTAQQAYATLMQDVQNAQQAQGAQQTGGTGQIGTDLAAVGSALQAGSITDAQSAFATLTQDLQSAQQTQATQQTQGTQQTYGHHHHHHHHGGGSQTASTSSGSTSLSTDLAAVGSALQAGSITDAQSAFATLMQDLGNSATGTSASSNSLFQAAGSNVNITV
ncbi:MAG: hypothetical protein ABSD38_12225 [Syntrophorhabdales bacterium]|jgi:hypothetical protein